MLQVSKTYDTSTLDGVVELLADSLAMPADNLAINMDSLLKQHISFTRQVAQALSHAPAGSPEHSRRLDQLQTITRGVEMILEAQDLLKAAKFMGAQLKPQPEIEPGPAIVRQ